MEQRSKFEELMVVGVLMALALLVVYLIFSFTDNLPRDLSTEIPRPEVLPTPVIETMPYTINGQECTLVYGEFRQVICP